MRAPWSRLTPDNVRTVVIEWADITNIPNWNDQEPVKYAVFRTLGWLLESNDDRIVIASTWNPEDGWSEFNVFPKSPVRSVA